MSSGGNMRIGIEGARELEVEVEDLEDALSRLEQSLIDGSMVWLTDIKGARHGIVGGRLAFVEAEPTDERQVGFGR